MADLKGRPVDPGATEKVGIWVEISFATPGGQEITHTMFIAEAKTIPAIGDQITVKGETGTITSVQETTEKGDTELE